ncbi:pentapeptide repeat-containing protein [Flavobacterium collinsii]|uniref:HTH cro/C1-type domain-containing protein n=1 Tax=Flavobacterium collinsii TaxID=1114861 RepID=A0A9W4TKX3_9FLAO|nr:pentapeptide repeat-containing protein [Flavobacterium collinsii]CAI2768823.1 HTH cro/C1-type domain-containing protein [Flavobacterium collinsii]
MLNTKMIGNKIAVARKKINLSQAQLAEHLFISSQAVGKWERGESMPDITTFNRLAEVLGVDLNYFSENFQSETSKTTPIEPLANQSDELLPIKQKKKLSWDMSNGNWVDADFSGLKNLSQKFGSSNMQRCLFIESDISGLILKNNNLNGCDFTNSNISNSNIQSSNLTHNIFKNCSLQETEFSRNYLKDCDFTGANFIGANFMKNNHLDNCDFSASDIRKGQILNSSLNKNTFKNCLLKEALFFKSHIKDCDFSDANFTEAEFKSGVFINNPVVNAIWNHTSFVEMQFDNIIFEGTLEDCYFENCEFKKVIFQNSTLTNTFFKNNNLKRVQFINCQTDKITYEFLKNNKADLTGITFLP